MHGRRLFRGIIALVGLLALVGAFPLTAGAADPLSSVPDPRYVITRLGDQSTVTATPRPMAGAQVQSFRFAAQGRVTAAGEPDELRLAMQGEFAMPDRFRATLTISDPTEPAPVTFDVIVIGDKLYIRLPPDLALDGKELWVLIDDPRGLGAVPGAKMPGLATLPPIPTQMQTLGDETINGVLTTRTRTTIDATALLGGSAQGAQPSTLTLDLWTGKADNFPRRLAINGTAAINPDALFGLDSSPRSAAATVTVTIAFTMDFTDINVPITIVAPATYVNLSSLRP